MTPAHALPARLQELKARFPWQFARPSRWLAVAAAVALGCAIQSYRLSDDAAWWEARAQAAQREFQTRHDAAWAEQELLLLARQESAADAARSWQLASPVSALATALVGIALTIGRRARMARIG